MTLPESLPSIPQLDGFDEATVARVLGPLFEDAPRFLSRLAAVRPFGSWAGLFAKAIQIARSMPADEQIELLDAHLRIGAPPARLSALSYHEQGYDLEQAEAIAALGPLNDAYEARFGFRFVVFVAGRPRSAIVPLLRAALDAERGAELTRGIDEVVAIARDRACTLGADIGEEGP